MTVLLHKTALVNFPMATTVNEALFILNRAALYLRIKHVQHEAIIKVKKLSPTRLLFLYEEEAVLGDKMLMELYIHA